MISEELLSGVLNIDDIHDNYEIMNDILFYNIDCTDEEDINAYESREINIYELAHKCKKWAFGLGYIIDSAFVPKGNFTSSYVMVRNHTQSINEYEYRVNADTEPESIFLACEWILKQKKEDD